MFLTIWVSYGEQQFIIMISVIAQEIVKSCRYTLYIRIALYSALGRLAWSFLPEIYDVQLTVLKDKPEIVLTVLAFMQITTINTL